MSATDTTPAPTITRDTKVSEVFESITCSRCGGSGFFGPMSVMAGKCFKCGGTGSTLTKRGAAARAFYRSLVETPVEVLQAGERIFCQGFRAGSFSQPSAWVTVERVVDCAAQAAAIGDYSEALKAAGSCSLLDTEEKVEAARQRGATVLPDGRGGFGCFEGLRIAGTGRDGTAYGIGKARGATVLAKIDPAVKVAVLKTVAEYQAALTKAGTPRKGSRWS